MPQKIPPMPTKRRFLQLRIPLAILAAIFMVFMTEVAYRSTHETMASLVNASKARQHLSYALQRITDAESGKRGYLLVGGDAYLTPYRQARSDVLHSLEAMRALDAQSDDPQLNAQHQEVQALMNAKLAEMDKVMALYESGEPTQAMALIRSGLGYQLMNQLRDKTHRFINYRNELMNKGLANANDLFQIWRIGFASMTLLSLTILVVFVRQSDTVEKERLAQRQALQIERDALKVDVESKMVDLRKLAKHLLTVREDERGRLARELHDELGALLTTAKLDVAVIKPKIQKDMPELLPKLSHLIDALNSGIALKRRIVEDLSPSTLKTLGLTPALEILINDMLRHTPIYVEQDLAVVNLGSDEQLVLYRVVQEFLTNTLKYAQAKHLFVTLKEAHGAVVLEIEDDGIGFDPSIVKTNRHGIHGMQFRVEASGGCLTVTSAPNEGTKMVATIPTPSNQGSATAL
jgi:signal transduction histidine kinase